MPALATSSAAAAAARCTLGSLLAARRAAVSSALPSAPSRAAVSSALPSAPSRAIRSMAALNALPGARGSEPLLAPSPLRRHEARRSVATRALTADDIRSKNAENPVIVYSKTYCPYCSEVKALFTKLNVAAKVVEIDTLADADAVSAALADVTGRRTVPQVFIGGEHVGGCDDTVAANKSGKLKELLGGVGVKV